MNFDIIEETKFKTKLIIRCKIERKVYADEQDIRITTNDVLERISKNYNIVQVLKEDEIWNTPRGNKHNYGIWIFKIKQTRIQKQEKEIEPSAENPPKTKNFRKRFKSLARK